MRAGHAVAGGLLLAALAGCDRNEQQAPAATAGAPAASGPRLAASHDDRVYVCRAAAAALNGDAPKQVDKAEAIGADGVRLVYQPYGGLVWNTECRFAGDQVSWRLTNVGVPDAGVTDLQPRGAEGALRYQMNGAQVRTVRTAPDGSSTISTWSSHERRVAPDGSSTMSSWSSRTEVTPR